MVLVGILGRFKQTLMQKGLYEALAEVFTSVGKYLQIWQDLQRVTAHKSYPITQWIFRKLLAN